MKDNPMTPRQLQEYASDAEKAVKRSYALWRPVNMAIARILQDAVRQGHSRQQVYSSLMKTAGRKKKGEPVVIENFRSAARQIASGATKLTLI